MTNSPSIPDRVYFRIGDVAELVGVKPYVLRYWESEFPMISPKKSPSGQRVYRRTDVETVIMIKRLLYDERYSIEGARKKIKELRKDGGLQTFKQAAAPPVANGGERLVEMKKILGDLRNLAKTPISKLFQF